MRKRIITGVAALAFLGGFLSAVQAQDGPKEDVLIETAPFNLPVPPPTGEIAVGSTFAFVHAEADIPGKVVKGAPYSAETVTETVQTLADGNRITNKMTSSIARDSEGRTRREQTLPTIGPWASDGAPAKMITIVDPVAGTTWMLDEQTKTARKGIRHSPGDFMGTAGKSPINIERHVQIATGEANATAGVRHENMIYIQHSGSADVKTENLPQPKTEQLGQKNIEGVVATGTRSTMTIEAGKIGNDRALDVVDERWYSNELQTPVLTKHSDPRMGETTYKLTRVSRAEPPRALFEVPADYKVVEGREPFKIRYEKRGPEGK